MITVKREASALLLPLPIEFPIGLIPGNLSRVVFLCVLKHLAVSHTEG